MDSKESKRGGETMAKRVTINRVNERIAPLGYELVKGRGYFHFAPLDISTHTHLYDSMVCTFHLSNWTVERWESELKERIDET